VAGLLLHVELGGDDFRPMLGQLEKMTRAQQAIRDQVAAARARLRFSAYVLVAAPVVILLVLRSWSPVVATFFDSAEGMVALLVCTLCVIGGYCLMLYLGRMPGEERVLVR
jgi:Flp pilus assembly protein TadB